MMRADWLNENFCDYARVTLRKRLTSLNLILSSYLYWGGGDPFPIFSWTVSSPWNTFYWSLRVAFANLKFGALLSSESGKFPNDVRACFDSS